MKKRLILIIILFSLSFIFIPKIKAGKMCYYQAQEGYYKARNWTGTIANCEADGKNCSHTDGYYKNFSASLEMPNTTTASDRPKVKTKYYAWVDAGENPPTAFVEDTCDVDNWSQTLGGTDITGIEYVHGNKCPGFLLVREGVFTYSHSASAFIASTKDEYTKLLEWILTSNKYSFQEFFFIAKKIRESEDEEEEEEKIDIKYNSCLDFKDDSGLCENNPVFSCLWVKKNIAGKKYEYCNFDDLTYVKCGDAWDIPSRVPGLISFLVNILKIATPIILIVVSVISLLKAVASSKEDAIKKAQSSLIRKLIAAAIVFFVVQITQFVILKVADSSEKNNISTCLSCMLNNDCSKNIYYKTKVGSNYECTPLTGTFNGECH